MFFPLLLGWPLSTFSLIFFYHSRDAINDRRRREGNKSCFCLTCYESKKEGRRILAMNSLCDKAGRIKAYPERCLDERRCHCATDLWSRFITLLSLICHTSNKDKIHQPSFFFDHWWHLPNKRKRSVGRSALLVKEAREKIEIIWGKK